MILKHLLYRVAYFTTALLHLHWNELISAGATITVMCLSNTKQPVVLRLFRLHAMVMLCFVLGALFDQVSASSGQALIGTSSVTLQFDDLETNHGWGDLSQPYAGLVFDGFYPFKPSHPTFEGLISVHDLNCAVSKPNALHGTRYNLQTRPASTKQQPQTTRLPSLRPSNEDAVFTLESIKMKPLNFPINQVRMHLRGVRATSDSSAPEDGSALEWSVDFPAGFHDVFHVKLEEFTHQTWDNLTRVEIWADFHNAGSSMDWEFCIDDLAVEFFVR
ncbi:hypothetical protein B0A52_06089 [Exophiala mesophila]|uniref:Uncharacterized protein n=1 Tax=Exophiala mesophila TaxID=212818 RepID=A0A438N5A1_EXOME|nr:hypothetical protein B0A52_06089 [Exophiala mesophila]